MVLVEAAVMETGTGYMLDQSHSCIGDINSPAQHSHRNVMMKSLVGEAGCTK
jgi:hypothetical protein